MILDQNINFLLSEIMNCDQKGLVKSMARDEISFIVCLKSRKK